MRRAGGRPASCQVAAARPVARLGYPPGCHDRDRSCERVDATRHSRSIARTVPRRSARRRASPGSLRRRSVRARTQPAAASASSTRSACGQRRSACRCARATEPARSASPPSATRNGTRGSAATRTATIAGRALTGRPSRPCWTRDGARLSAAETGELRLGTIDVRRLRGAQVPSGNRGGQAAHDPQRNSSPPDWKSRCGQRALEGRHPRTPAAAKREPGHS